MFVELTSECYLKNQSISQIALVDASVNAPIPQNETDSPKMETQNSRVSATSKLLVAIWNKPGYRLIERNPYELKEIPLKEEVKAEDGDEE